jgi:hypothetical protein
MKKRVSIIEKKDEKCNRIIPEVQDKEAAANELRKVIPTYSARAQLFSKLFLVKFNKAFSKIRFLL